MVLSEDPQPIWRTAPVCTYGTLEQGIHGREGRDFPSSPLALEEVLELPSDGLRNATDGSAAIRIGCAFTNGEKLGAFSNGKLTLPAAIARCPGPRAKVTS